MTKELFEEITQWQDTTFQKSTASSRAKHLKKEIEELIKELERKPVIAVLSESEFADCFFLLFGAAKAYGMTYEDIQQCIRKKFKINKDRTWGKPDENGVVEHVKKNIS